MEYLGPVRFPPGEKGRDIVVVLLGGERQGFYRSSGRNSGMPGKWLPFDGVALLMGSTWFDKENYLGVGEYFRVGSAKLLAASLELGSLDIPAGRVLSSPVEVNEFLGTPRSLSNNRFFMEG